MVGSVWDNIVWMDGIFLKVQQIGMWLGENESASFWMSVLTDLKARGVQSITQICVVHEIRSASRFVVWKEKKEFASDLKPIYTAVNKELTWSALEALEIKWSKKYPHAVKS